MIESNKYALQDRNPNLVKLSSLDEPRPKERKLTSSFRGWWAGGRVSGLNMQEVRGA